MVLGLVNQKALLWEMQAFCVLLCSPNLKILDKSLVWRDFAVHEEGQSQPNPEFFAAQKETVKWEGKQYVRSKIVQVNKTDVYVIGGR